MYMSAIVADFLKLDQACISQFVFNCESPLLGYYNRARSRDFGRVIKAKKVVKGNKTVQFTYHRNSPKISYQLQRKKSATVKVQ